VGADLYCDTHCIARVLDRLHPGAPLAPPGRELEAEALGRWGETTFMMAVVACFGIGGVFPEDFVEDRRNTMVPPDTNLDAAPVLLPTKLLQIRANLERLEDLLGDGRTFLLGTEASIADLAAFHPLLFLPAHPRLLALLDGLERVPAWRERVRAIGHGKRTELGASDAIAVARDATPVAYEGEPALPEGIALGDAIVVLPDEYGSGNITGHLAESGIHEIAVRRQSERAGEVVVHLPREDYAIVKAG
jgi:glutathione S-transferase